MTPNPAPASLPLAEHFTAIAQRDRSFDGQFLYAVKTTGIYCRPSCASRPARPENIVVYPDAQAAEAAGLRACKRCRPNQDHAPDPNSLAIRRACRLIERACEPPSLTQLAAAARLSPHHFHRIFRKAMGITPKAYAAAVQARRLAANLRAPGSITAAIHDSGYSSSSRFYETAAARLGMPPSTVKKSGLGATIRFAVGQSSLGAILVAATGSGVCAILLGDDPGQLIRDFQDRYKHAELAGADPHFEATVALAVGLVEAPAQAAGLPLDIRGTAFQQRVWQALRAIPPGHTASYAEIAAGIGRSGAARAVARACASNTLAIAIPCHRVVRTDSSLSGYRWGIERKRELLRREAAACGAE